MLFRNQQSEILAISQPAHAWVSGQMLRAWDDELPEPLLLAAEQHDIGWLDWETDPSFDPRTGRPHLFRDIGASIHAPMWTKGTTRALHAWGAHVALLISRHGGVIYRRFIDRHRLSDADAEAAQNFLETQAPLEAAWAHAVGLDAEAQRRETALLAAVDTLSLVVCGELKTPLTLEAVDRRGARIEMQIAAKPESPFEFLLSPWPFRRDSLVVEGEARALPAEGRFADEAAMCAWLASDERTSFRSRLAPV